MAKFLVFCESPADLETIRALSERVLREQGPEWVRDLLEDAPDARGLWEWLPDGEGRSYFDLHKLSTYASRRKVRVPHGHFAGRPGEAGALMGRTAFLVARELSFESTSPDAVLLVWDMDDQSSRRREGLEQARAEARSLMPFAIVLGCPDPMREAWVLAGFEPETTDERERLTALRQELGFNPCDEAHRLDAKNEQAKRSPKRVLDELTDGEHTRKARCWSEAPLERLRARGQHSGLRLFLDEAKESLVPLLSGRPPRRPPT